MIDNSTTCIDIVKSETQIKYFLLISHTLEKIFKKGRFQTVVAVKVF